MWVPPLERRLILLTEALPTGKSSFGDRFFLLVF